MNLSIRSIVRVFKRFERHCNYKYIGTIGGIFCLFLTLILNVRQYSHLAGRFQTSRLSLTANPNFDENKLLILREAPLSEGQEDEAQTAQQLGPYLFLQNATRKQWYHTWHSFLDSLVPILIYGTEIYPKMRSYCGTNYRTFQLLLNGAVAALQLPTKCFEIFWADNTVRETDNSTSQILSFLKKFMSLVNFLLYAVLKSYLTTSFARIPLSIVHFQWKDILYNSAIIMTVEFACEIYIVFAAAFTLQDFSGDYTAVVTYYGEKIGFPANRIFILDDTDEFSMLIPKSPRITGGLGFYALMVPLSILEKLHSDELIALFTHEIAHWKYNHLNIWKFGSYISYCFRQWLVIYFIRSKKQCKDFGIQFMEPAATTTLADIEISASKSSESVTTNPSLATEKPRHNIYSVGQFLFVYEILGFFISAFKSMWIKSEELQCDRFVKQTGQGLHLKTVLEKMACEKHHAIIPQDPIYNKVFSCVPRLEDRLKILDSNEENL